MIDLDALRTLLRDYLSPDEVARYGSLESAVRAFKREGNVRRTAGARDALRWVQTAYLDEVSTEDSLDLVEATMELEEQLGMPVSLPEVGLSPADFVETVVGLLSALLD